MVEINQMLMQIMSGGRRRRHRDDGYDGHDGHYDHDGGCGCGKRHRKHDCCGKRRRRCCPPKCPPCKCPGGEFVSGIIGGPLLSCKCCKPGKGCGFCPPDECAYQDNIVPCTVCGCGCGKIPECPPPCCRKRCKCKRHH